jgi:oxygen-independent coproporphyrinogen-3 oxidase
VTQSDPDPVPDPDPESGTETDSAFNAGLYVHVPFCTSVCPYCDFAVTIAGEERRSAWVDGIIREAALYPDLSLGFDTVYLGGGTPSSLDTEQIGRILDELHRHLAVDQRAVCSLEVNPEDVDPRSVSTWRDFGISYVSLGVQSFDDRDLALLGRRHSVDDARQAAEILCSAGFDTVSVDLIYGLEGRSPEHWRRQLETAVALGVDHLSCYQLTAHEGTLFGRRVARGAVTELGEGELAELFFLTHELLADAGYDGYEVSNFASTAEHRSDHNQKYWDHTPYLGLGPSAHSFVGGRRWWNHRKLRHWQAAIDAGDAAVEDEERPSGAQLALEALMLGFRTTAGIDLERLHERFGVGLLGTNGDVVDRWVTSGHLKTDGARLRPTLTGLAIADTLARSFEIGWPPTESGSLP